MATHLAADSWLPTPLPRPQLTHQASPTRPAPLWWWSLRCPRRGGSRWGACPGRTGLAQEGSPRNLQGGGEDAGAPEDGAARSGGRHAPLPTSDGPAGHPGEAAHGVRVGQSGGGGRDMHQARGGGHGAEQGLEHG